MLQVAIIGAGMAGPALALCLKKHGISSEIFELREEGYEKGGCIALAPNALRVMDHVGVYDRLRLGGFNYEEVEFCNNKGAALGRVFNGNQSIYHYPALRIHRTTVMRELVAECRSRQIPVHYGWRCVGVKGETDESATVEFDGGRVVEAQFVVAADGLHSKIRPFLAPGTTPEYSGFMGIIGTLDKSLIKSAYPMHFPCMMFGDNGSFAIFPSSFDGQEISYFSTMEYKDLGRDGWAQLENSKEELKSMLTKDFAREQNNWPPVVKEMVEKASSETLTSWPFYAVPHMDKFTSPKKRIILIGDAAHAIPPMGGQGAAMGFEDAETLAYVLGRIRAPDFDSAKFDETFTKWEHDRLARITKVIDFTTKNGKYRKSSHHVYEEAAKEWMIWVALKWTGPEASARWLFSYNCEDMLGVLA